MTAQKTLKPYRPFSTANNERIEHLPNERIFSSDQNGEETSPLPEQKLPDSTPAAPKVSPAPAVLPPPPRSKFFPVLLFLAAAVFIFGIFSFFSFQPKLRSLNIIKGLKEPLTALSSSLVKVNDSLFRIGNVRISPNNEEGKPPPAKAETGPVNLQEAVVFSQTSIAEARRSIGNAKNRLPEKYPPALTEIIGETEDFLKKSAVVNEEAAIIAGYYKELIDFEAGFDLIEKGFSSDLLDPLDNDAQIRRLGLNQKIKEEEEKLRRLDRNLPKDLEKMLNEETASLILLSDYLKEIDQSGKNGQSLPSFRKLETELEDVRNRAKQAEIAFWRESSMRSKLTKIEEESRKLLDRIETLRKKNRLPFFN